MTLLSILDRFRPAGAPGSAGVVGVPAVDVNGPATELAPVFAALRPDLEARADLVASARADALALIDSARERAAALVAKARLEADGARAAAASAVQDESAASDELLLRSAREQVAGMDAVGRERAAALASRLAAALLDTGSGAGP